MITVELQNQESIAKFRSKFMRAWDGYALVEGFDQDEKFPKKLELFLEPKIKVATLIPYSEVIIRC